MKGFQRLGRAGRVLVGVTVAGAIFGIASAVQASIPDSSGVIHGCYNKKGAGELRVIDTSAPKQNSCSKSEAALNWNQTGPAGVKGATGTTGATGPSGPTGAAGPDFLTGHIVSVLADTDSNYGTVEGIAAASGSETPVDVLSPDRATTATHATLRTTGTVGSSGLNVYLLVNGTLNGICHVFTSAGCSVPLNVSVPANSTLALQIGNCCDPSPGDMLVTVDLQ